MADNDGNDNGRRPTRGRPDQRGSPPRGGDRPFRKGGGKPFRGKGGDGNRAPQSDGERPFRKPRFGGDKPRFGGDKPRFGGDKSRSGDDRPRIRGERPLRKPDKAGGRQGSDRAHDDRPPRPRGAEIPAPAPEPTEERIAKVIARAGIASRRDAEAMITEGRVTLNGAVLASPAVNVTAEDRITIDGEPLPPRERTRLWIFHKPRGLVTTARDPQGRATVFDSLPEDLPRVVAIGRLDINTEGLLLLTNDGGLARVIAHPDTGWLRRYKVRAHGDITQEQLDPLLRGITIEGIDYGPIEARLDRIQGDNVWLTMGLREGKNREIKTILEHLGLDVNRLIRLSFGPFQLGDLEPGLVEEVRTKVLREQLGQVLAEQAGVDFASPVREPIAPFGTKPETRADERPARDSRPPRGRDDDRPRRPRDGERPFRGGGERPFRGAGERSGRGDERRGPGSAARERPPHGERRPSVWRAEDAEPRRAGKAPRRGADAKAARAASGARQHERVGAIKAGEGRKVLVERLVSETKPDAERPARKPRGEAPRRAPSGDDRPRRRDDRDSWERPRRATRDEGGRRDKDERPRGAGGGPRPARPGSGPRGSGPKRAGPKGPPRDRRR
jgi:23S rRNA pseudouridine2605 synthase